MTLKEKLMATELFLDNEHLQAYVRLIENNYSTKKQKNKTQQHHIIPKVAFLLYNWEGMNNKQNLVNLLYKDHILAHYYLALAAKQSYFQHKMFISINFILGRARQAKLNIEQLQKEFMDNIDLNQYQELYEISKQETSKLRKGTHHSTSEETKNKIGKANSNKIYVNKDGVVRSLQPEEVCLFLNNGWVLGNPNCSKRELSTGRKIIHKENCEKVVPKDQLDNYLNDGWTLGLSEQHKQRTQKGVQKHMDSLSPEEKQKFTSYGALGKHRSEETKEKQRRALKGRKGSEKQKILNSINKKGTIHMTNGEKNIMIKKELESEFLARGFYRGRIIKKNKNNNNI